MTLAPSQESSPNSDRLPPRHRPSRRVRTAIWIAYWFVLFILTHMPVMGGVKLPQFSDKVIHFVLFFLLAFLGGWRYRTNPTAGLRGLIIWTVIFIVYAGLDEWLQQFVGRNTCLNDFWADLAGITVATLTLLMFRRPHPLSDPPSSG